MSFALVPGLYLGPLRRTRIGRHLETSSLVRGRQERQHPPRVGRSPGQVDRRLQRPLHPHRGVRAPHGRSRRRGLAVHQWKFDRPMVDLGWKSVGVLELTALPSIDEERWVPMVRATDVLLVAGGDALYLCHWMRQSGLADLLPSLDETVWVGLSAGSMVMTPRIGESFVGWKPPAGGDETLGIVDFSIFPHVDHEDLPGNSMAEAERWAAGIPNRAYAIDDQTAIKVVDGTVEVVSEGHWKLLAPGSGQLVLREIEDRDLGVLFEHARDRDAIRMAAFTSPEADDRTAFERRWTRLRSDGATTNRVIEIDDRVVGHIASFDMEGQ